MSRPSGPGLAGFAAPGCADGDDEDLPQRPARDWSRLVRVARPVLVVAALALAVVWVLGAHVGPRPTRHVAASSGTARPLPVVRLPHGVLAGKSVTVTFPGTGTAQIITNRGLGTLCPPLNACATTRLLPAAAIAALRAAFRDVRVVSATTVAYVDHHDGHHSLWYRTLHAVAPGRTVDITVDPLTPEDHTDTGFVPDGSGVQIYTHRLVGSYAIQIVVHADGSPAHPVELLRGLPADHRLLAVS